MPYMRRGKCVYKKNPDGSKGKKVGCSDTVEDAKKYIKRLYMEEKKSQAFSELSMYICKASREKSDGTMRLSLVNSDTGEDVFGERMSVELFDDFVMRSDAGLPVPAPFDEVVHEKNWQGGAPYLSIAHYKSNAFDEFPGEQEKIYRDGEKLKSKDILYNNKLGNAVWKSVYEDLYAEEKEYDNPVRVSIGFLDLAHKHELDEEIYFERKSLEDKCEACEQGLGGKVYLKGHLVHKAFTRVPAHPRTDVEIEMKSNIETKREDAESIIGNDIPIEEKSSLRDDVMVVKAEESRDPENLEDNMTEEITQEEVVEEVQETAEPVEENVEEPTEEVQEVVDEPEVEEVAGKSAIVAKAEEIEAKAVALKEKGVYGDEALIQIQPLFDELGEVLKSETAPTGEVANVNAVIKSTVQEAIADLKGDIVAEIVKQLSGTIKPEQKVEVPEASIPQPRSLVNKANLQPEQKKQLSQIEAIARKSVGM